MSTVCPLCQQEVTPELADEITAAMEPEDPGADPNAAAPAPPAAGGDPMAAGSMVEAMNRELDDPAKKAARALRKE